MNIIDELYQENLLTKEEDEGILDASSKDDSKAVNRHVLIVVSRRPAGYVIALAEVLRKKHRSLAGVLEKDP